MAGGSAKKRSERKPSLAPVMRTTFARRLPMAPLIVFGDLTFGPPEKLFLGRYGFQEELRMSLIVELLKALGNLLLQLTIKRLFGEILPDCFQFLVDLRRNAADAF